MLSTVLAALFMDYLAMQQPFGGGGDLGRLMERGKEEEI